MFVGVLFINLTDGKVQKIVLDQRRDFAMRRHYSSYFVALDYFSSRPKTFERDFS